ncbi:MAG: hypothetical protein ACOYBW_05345 [Fluviibacter phosphoraccumulans]
MFLIEPKYQKCATQVELWKKGSVVVERAQLWRFAKVTVECESLKKLNGILAGKDVFDRICVTEVLDIVDQELKDCVSDDLYLPDEFPEKEQKRLQNLFKKDPEGMFEAEGWEISETSLSLEGELKVSKV